MTMTTNQFAPQAVNGVSHKVLHAVRGINDQITGWREETVNQLAHARPMNPILASYDPFNDLLEGKSMAGRPRKMSLLEAFVDQPDAANLLRDGIRFLAFSRMREMPKVWPMAAAVETSNKPQEEYLRDASIGVIPRNPSGQPVKFIQSSFEGSTTIKNHLYRVGIEVTGDDIKFDRLGKIRQIARELGRAAATTEDYEFFVDITTTANYTRNSTTQDNDVGANTQTLTFNALSLDTALTVISTSRDRKSSQPLGYSANTLVCSPKLEYAAKQMLMSDNLARTHGNTTAEVRGMGDMNPYNGIFDTIICSPWFGSNYEWAIFDNRVYSYVWQTVDPWQILQDGMVETSESWLMLNALRYVITGYFGHGFVDDRAWFFSDSTTAPTVS